MPGHLPVCVDECLLRLNELGCQAICLLLCCSRGRLCLRQLTLELRHLC
jgi:hypothetical protein